MNADCTCVFEDGEGPCPRCRNLEAESVQLGNLLAIIHRDGGHHQAAVGTSQAVLDAHQVWANMMTENGRLTCDLADARLTIAGKLKFVKVEIDGKPVQCLIDPAWEANFQTALVAAQEEIAKWKASAEGVAREYSRAMTEKNARIDALGNFDDVMKQAKHDIARQAEEIRQLKAWQEARLAEPISVPPSKEPSNV